MAKQIEESGNWGPVGSFAYQTGMSMADFLFTTAITGGNQTLSLAVMGSGAAADTTIAAKDRGLEDWQAFTLGTVAGIAEVAMEKISLDTLLDSNLLREGTLKYILKNMVAEGGEEVGTDAINLLADILVSRDESEWQKSIDAYVSGGMTEGEALGRAILDQAVTMGLDFLGGAISGGIMSGGASIAFNHNTSNLGKELGKQNFSPEDVQAFIETGLESDPDTDAYKIAKELQAKVKAGQTISDFDLSRQYQANVQAVAQEQQAEEGTEAPAEGEVTGLQLSELENDTQGYTVAPLNNETGVRGEVNGSAQSNSSPVSLAEKLRREQNLNGGIENVNTDERTAGPAIAQPESGAAGASASDGGQGRYAGQSAGKQTGFVAGGTTGQRNTAEIERRRTAIDRQNRIGHLRLEKVSSQDLGLQSGTEAKSIRVIPQEHWDSELSQIAERIYKETGKNVTFVMGRIQVRGAGGNIGYARGVISGENVFVQADNFQASAEQIADHEAFHAKSDFFNGTLNEQIRQRIIETFSEEQFRTVLEKYIIALRGVYNAADIKSGDEYESMVRMIEEEVFADAYAGINAFGAGADQFTDAVNERMDQLYVGKLRDQEDGTKKTTGPPVKKENAAFGDDRYSLSNDFAIEIQEWFDQSTPEERLLSGRRFLVGTTSDVLKSIGVKEYNIYFGASKIAKILQNNPSMTLDTIKEAVRLLEDPILIMKSATVEDSLVLFGEVYTSGGKPVMISVLLNPKTKSGDVLDYAVITSAYGRRARNLQNLINTSKIHYVNENKNRTENWLKALGLQLPSALTKFGPISSVYEQGQNVKERFSYAGENANNADLEALERAKEMQAAGVADESIRQETGWFVGMDGKWRWEINDSGMKYTQRGDLGFRERNPGYVRYRELLDKSNRYALELSDEAPTEAERSELNRLSEIWRGTFQKPGRITEDALPQDRLADYLQHDELFEAYPQLRKTTLRFADLPDGIRGQYDPSQNSITLDESLRRAPEDTLAHEIQHAIQNAEGFASGSSTRFWDDRQVAKPEYASEIQKAEQAVERAEAAFRKEWADDINLNLVKQYVELDNRLWDEETDPLKQQELADQMEQIEQVAAEAGWEDLLNDYY